MITRFSESIRRNQKQWMVVITILAVFSFVFDDLIRGAGNASGGLVVFVAVFIAAGMSIIGYRRGKTTEFGLAGLVVGALVGFVWLRSAGPPVVARTNDGTYTQADIARLQTRRQRAERFLFLATKKIDKQRPFSGFGSTDIHAMVTFATLQAEARRMGVVVSDDSVNKFLSELTGGKLIAKDYNDALREAGLSEGELFDFVRAELEVQLVSNLISAPAETGQYIDMTRFRINEVRVAPQTPEELWQSFRKLHVRQGLTSVTVPVTEFVALVPEPTEAELRDFFDKHKNSYGDNQGTPGFLESPKVRLAYLAVNNLEAYEKLVPEISDQEVIDYYLAHRESFRINEIPSDSGPLLPDFMPDFPSGDSAPADATQVENVGEAKVESPPVEAPPGTSKGEKPADPVKPAEPDKPDAAPAKGGLPCGDEPAPDKAAEKAADDKQDASAAKAVEPPATSDATSPPAPALPSDEPADATAPSGGADSGPPALNTSPRPPSVPRYRELDDDLKDQIREIMLRDKAFLKMAKTADQVHEEVMMTLSLKYSALTAKERESAGASYAAELKSYADKHGLEYTETKELTQFDLMNPTGDAIGNATDPLGRMNASRRPTSVAEEVFAREASGRGYQLPLYSPRRADTRSTCYSYWKILEVPPEVPDLKDELVRKRVLDAYKFDKARPLAEKRAGELAELMKKNPTDVAAALTGQTINGTSDSPAVTVRESGRFSCLHQQQSVSQPSFDPPMPSTIDGIGQPGDQFMKTVFEDLANGETGLTVDSSRTAYFAVRVHDRDGSGADDDVAASLESLQARFAREQFKSNFLTPYEHLAAVVQQGVDQRWAVDFYKRFGIKIENETATRMEEQ